MCRSVRGSARWDHQAWNDARPGKIVPTDGAEMTAQWVAKLRALGYRNPAAPAPAAGVAVGRIDGDAAAVPVPRLLSERLAAHIAGKKPDDLVFTGVRGGGVLRNRTFRGASFDRAAAI